MGHRQLGAEVTKVGDEGQGQHVGMAFDNGLLVDLAAWPISLDKGRVPARHTEPRKTD